MKNITCFSCCIYILLNLDQKNERYEMLIESIIVTDFNFRKMIMNKTNMLLVFVLRRVQAGKRRRYGKTRMLYVCLHPNEK